MKKAKVLLCTVLTVSLLAACMAPLFVSAATVDLMDVTINTALAPHTCSQNHATLYDPDKNMESFLFYTDAHLALHSYWQTTVNNTFNYLDKLATSLSLDFVVDGGDWLSAGDTPALAEEKLTYIKDKATAFKTAHNVPLYLTVGNHDTNYQGTEILPNETIASIWYPEYNQNYYRFDSAKSSNYVLDSQLDAESDDTRAYIQQELIWLLNDLKTNNASHIHIFSHIIYNNGTTTDMAEDLGRIIKAYNDRLSFDFYGTTYDFAANTGRIELVMSGHTHHEESSMLGGVPSVNCNSLSRNGNVDKEPFEACYRVIKDYENNQVHVYNVCTDECRCYDLTGLEAPLTTDKAGVLNVDPLPENNRQGLRFWQTLTTTDGTDGTEKITVAGTEYTLKSVHMLAAKTDALTDLAQLNAAEAAVNGQIQENRIETFQTVVEDGNQNTYTFAVYMTKIGMHNRETNISIRPYVRCVDSTGGERVFYGEVTTTSVKRTYDAAVLAGTDFLPSVDDWMTSWSWNSAPAGDGVIFDFGLG